MAGVWRLPGVFVAVNNGWAISVPRARQTAAGDAGAEGRSPPASGASRSTATTSSPSATWSTRALARARAGEGPALVEALTYRLADHTTADDATRYRDDGRGQRRTGRRNRWCGCAAISARGLVGQRRRARAACRMHEADRGGGRGLSRTAPQRPEVDLRPPLSRLAARPRPRSAKRLLAGDHVHG